MLSEIKNQSLGLIEVFKKEPELIPASAGRGIKPPRNITAVGLTEPEERRTPVPFAFIDALESGRGLKWKKDVPYDEIMDRILILALDNVPVEELPGLDETLKRYFPLDDPSLPKPSKQELDRFMVSAYRAGFIKPQNWRERVTLPIRYGIKGHRVKVRA